MVQTRNPWTPDSPKRRGGWYIGYRLTEYDSGSATVLFEGYDFSASPMWAVDSDECMGCIMGFLTLRPGDTDEEFFEDYTPRQLEFCDQHDRKHLVQSRSTADLEKSNFNTQTQLGERS